LRIISFSKSSKMALQMSSVVDIVCENGLPALLRAIMNSDKLEFASLLAENTNTEVRNERRMISLHLAALMGLEGLVMQLLKADANINAEDHEDIILLHYAAWYLHYAVFKLLETKKKYRQGD